MMGSGEIWSSGAFAFESPLKDLLDSLDYSLEDLLAEDELLQELRGLHPELITFFSVEENVANLVRCLIAPTPSFEETIKDDNASPEKKSGFSDSDSDGLNGIKLTGDENSEQTNGDNYANVLDENGNDSDSEPEPDLKELDLSRETIEGSDEIASPGKWLLENITERTLHGDYDNQESTKPNHQSREEYDNRYIRYPYMACEVICCEVTNILDVIVDGNVPIENGNDDSQKESILDLLFSMLYNAPEFELDDRRAGYLEKILTVLFRKKRAQLTAYINGDHLGHTVSDDEDAEEVDSAKQENGDIDETVTHHKGGGKQLLEVLFKHLHSNSISQIIQRLLMPKPPTSICNSFDQGNDSEGGKNGESPISGHDDDDDDDDEEANADDYGGINCDWADSDVGLNYLLEYLLIEPNSIGEDDESFSEEKEKILSASQHACEILTTVVQHSPLSSNMMITMTGEPILSRLIECASGKSADSPPAIFSMHDSTMTTTMNVLEILILQLGGYGTVPTSTQDNNDDHDLNENDLGTKHDSGSSGLPDSLKEAEAAALIRLLPNFLACLLNLLRHPLTASWKSHFQYSKEPQQMLGASRLRIVRLLESLVLLSIRDVDLILCGSECLETCLDLFWQFPWCSMLHQSVANLLVHILEGGVERIDLQIYFLSRCNLPKRLMDSFETALYSCPIEDDGLIAETFETNGEFSTVLAMKNCENGGSGSSSLDVERGSEESSDEIDEIMESSKIDIENALGSEQKSEENNQMNGELLEDSTAQDESKTIRKPITFRMGYMGHVIIICQALVHACGAMEQGSDNIEENTSEKESKQNDDGPNDSLSASEHSRINKPQESALQGEPAPCAPQRNMILSLLRGNRHYKIWINFVTTTLASETAVQSTPLGGFNAQEEINASEQQTESTSEDSFGCHLDEDSDLPDSAAFGTYGVSGGDIDLDDVDVDIAASIMESMNITPSEDTSSSNENTGQMRGHSRQRGVIGGQGVGNGTAFGTVVEMHKKPDEYVYDDPLGTRDHFDDGLNSDSDEEEPDGNGDTNDADGDDEAPVMDLFAGNFNFDKANIEADESDDAEGWANFDDGDFSPGLIADDIKQPSQKFDSQSDPFCVSDVFGIVAHSANIISSLDDENEEHANIISSLENLGDDIVIQNEELKTSEQPLHIEDGEQ